MNSLIITILTIGLNHISFDDRVTVGSFDFAVGDSFRDLSPETKDFFHKTKYYKQAQPTHGSDYMAANTDGCWSYTADCKPDYFHYIFKIPMVEHPGFFYQVTFSYNWKILAITNNYTHSS